MLFIFSLFSFLIWCGILFRSEEAIISEFQRFSQRRYLQLTIPPAQRDGRERWLEWLEEAVNLDTGDRQTEGLQTEEVRVRQRNLVTVV